jgi:hypothetical protein
MIIRTMAVIALVSLSACSKAPAPQGQKYEDQKYVDPITGEITVMSVVTLGKLEVVADRNKPDAFGLISVRGKTIAGYSCEPDGSCSISAFDGKNPDVTVKTRPRGEGLKEISVWGSEWFTVDSNADGQSDFRTRHGSKTSEIWLDGKWVSITTTGKGKDRKTFVGDRGVMLSDKGWVYRDR